MLEARYRHLRVATFELLKALLPIVENASNSVLEALKQTQATQEAIYIRKRKDYCLHDKLYPGAEVRVNSAIWLFASGFLTIDEDEDLEELRSKSGFDTVP